MSSAGRSRCCGPAGRWCSEDRRRGTARRGSPCFPSTRWLRARWGTSAAGCSGASGGGLSESASWCTPAPPRSEESWSESPCATRAESSSLWGSNAAEAGNRLFVDFGDLPVPRRLDVDPGQIVEVVGGARGASLPRGGGDDARACANAPRARRAQATRQGQGLRRTAEIRLRPDCRSRTIASPKRQRRSALRIRHPGERARATRIERNLPYFHENNTKNM